MYNPAETKLSFLGSLATGGVLMSTRKLTISLFAAVLLLAGGSTHAAKADAETAISDIKPGHAQIVFLRRTTVNALAGTTIYDVTSGEPKAVGKLTNSRKLIVDIPPGEYVFMVGNAGIQDFMPTTVLADKRYYVVVNAVWPAWFSMRPVRHKDGEFLYGSEQVNTMVEKTKLAKPYIDDADAKEKEKILGSYQVSWQKWQEKNAEQRAVLTLRPEDSLN